MCDARGMAGAAGVGRGLGVCRGGGGCESVLWASLWECVAGPRDERGWEEMGEECSFGGGGVSVSDRKERRYGANKPQAQKKGRQEGKQEKKKAQSMKRKEPSKTDTRKRENRKNSC